MGIFLYHYNNSVCSQKVRMTLFEKGLEWEGREIDLFKGGQFDPEYLKLNPKAVVPTLDHDGNVVIDSSVIIEYLDEIVPEPQSFTPEAPVARAKMRALMRFIDEMPAAAVRVPTFNLAFLPRFAAMSEEEFLAFADSKPLRKEFMLAMGRKGFPEQEMNAALERMRRTYERMDAEIAATGGPWLMGKHITLADVAVMPALVRMADLNLDTMWKAMPRIVRWYDEIRAQAAFKPTYYFGSLLTERFAHLRPKPGQA